jgi:TatD DNase family protein
MLRLVDTHCHLDVQEFDADRDAVVARARAAGVTRQIVPAIEAATWPGLARCLRARCGPVPRLWAASVVDRIASRRALARTCVRGSNASVPSPSANAAWITGWRTWTATCRRRSSMRKLRLAREFDLPVVVHARRAVDAVIASIKRIGGLRGVIHSYPGSEEQARQLAELGFLIGIGGPVTYERANKVRRVAANVPFETLLLETDAPDQPDSTHRGERNEPARITRVLEVIAGLRGVDAEVIADATSRNAERLFALPSIA